MSAFDYINRTYGLSLKRGSRVEYTGNRSKGPQQGVVASAAGGYINIRFDGTNKIVGPFHPTWEMRQLHEEPSP
jgi:hypothetical protein